MGQTVRQTLPFNARYAFMQVGKNGRYSQKTRPIGPTPPQSGYGQLVKLSLATFDPKQTSGYSNGAAIFHRNSLDV
ncbi:hypothetical protein AB7M26_003496 [Pseudomonas sp. F-14 TE3482]